MKGDRALINRAASVLEGGSTHTLDLAREVLGLSGHPGAASAAVFTLLGTDTRFHVDPGGVWSFRGPRPGAPLAKLAYAVVDVETTGGPYRRGHRITEVAIYQVRDGVVADEFHTLVNPGRVIPPRIEVLTGIPMTWCPPPPTSIRSHPTFWSDSRVGSSWRTTRASTGGS